MNQDQTTTNIRNGTFLTPVFACTMLFGIGTGGNYTPSYHAARTDKCVYCSHELGERNTPKSAIADDIEFIQSTLDLTMTELARCLNVSRQAPYNWMAGGRLKPENAERLNELKAAAEVIAAADIESRPLFMQRKLPGGKTLIEAIKGGSDARVVAQSLIDLFRTEADQRKMLATHFAGRRATT